MISDRRQKHEVGLPLLVTTSVRRTFAVTLLSLDTYVPVSFWKKLIVSPRAVIKDLLGRRSVEYWIEPLMI